VEREVLSSSSWDPAGKHGNGSKLYQGRFRLDVRKHFFTEREVRHCNRISRDVINTPILSVFKRHLDNALNEFGQP